MFRMLSPWDGWAWGRPDDDEAYPFAAPPSRSHRAPAPMEDFFFDHPSAYVHPAHRSSRPSRPTPPAAFFPGYPRQPRRQTFFPVPAASDPYDSLLQEDPYGFPNYPRRPAAPAPAFHPAAAARAHFPLHANPPAVAAAAEDDDNDADSYDAAAAEEDEPMIPVLSDNGYGYFLTRPRSQQRRQPSAQRAQQQQRSAVKAQQPLAAPSGRAGGKANSADGGSTSDADGGDGGDHNQPGHRQQPLLFFDPSTGLCFRAVPTAPPAGSSTRKTAAAATSRDSSAATATAAAATAASSKPASEKKSAAASAVPAAAAATSPQRSSTTTTTTAAAAAAAAAAGPTRIAVRAADSSGGVAISVPVVSAPPSAFAAASPQPLNGGGATASAAAASPSLERQTSTALVTRPAMEVALSRGPSAVLPSAAAAAAASASAAVAAAAPSKAAATAAAPAPTGAAGQAARSPAPRAKGPFATAGAIPVSRMTRSQAARTIQRWWRGWRLWRHGAALRQLAALAADLRAAAARFYAFMGATGGNITNKQQLEVNELAMRAILKLDSMEGLPLEFRALRKHLTARALRLQDEANAAYATSLMRPAQQQQHGQQGQQHREALSAAASRDESTPPETREAAVPSPSADGSPAMLEKVEVEEKEKEVGSLTMPPLKKEPSRDAGGAATGAAVAAAPTATAQANSAEEVSVSAEHVPSISGAAREGPEGDVTAAAAAGEPVPEPVPEPEAAEPRSSDTVPSPPPPPSSSDENSAEQQPPLPQQQQCPGGSSGLELHVHAHAHPSTLAHAHAHAQSHPPAYPRGHLNLHVSRRPRRLAGGLFRTAPSQQQQRRPATALPAVTAAVTSVASRRAAHGIHKHIVSRRCGSGGRKGTSGGAKERGGGDAGADFIETGRLQRRRIGAAATAAAAGVGGAKVHHHASGGQAAGAGCGAACVPMRHGRTQSKQQRRREPVTQLQKMRQQLQQLQHQLQQLQLRQPQQLQQPQQQPQQQPAVALRLVVRGGGKDDCRTAVLVDAGAQTD